MKAFFAKEITERPRRGSSNPSAKAVWYGKIVETEDGLDYDGLMRLPVSSKQEGYHKKIGDKHFTDVLGPIQGYLLNSCGRPWDDVFSELSKNLGQGTWPVRHILTQHVDVKTNTYRGIDGNVWYFDTYGPGPISGSVSYPTFYVEPESRCLRVCTKQVIVKRYIRYRNVQVAEIIKKRGERIQDGDHWFVEIAGIWYIGVYKKVPFYGVYGVEDRGRRYGRYNYPDPVWPNLSAGHRDGTLVFTKIKQANKKELRRMRELAKMPRWQKAKSR
jgi:hypothetical protein